MFVLDILRVGFVVGAPILEGVEDGFEGFAEVGQRVLHPRRHFGKYFALDKSVVFERAQVVRQHLFADAGDTLDKIRKPLFATVN